MRSRWRWRKLAGSWLLILAADAAKTSNWTNSRGYPRPERPYHRTHARDPPRALGRRRATELHEDRSGHRRARAPPRPGAPHPGAHRAALRRRDVEDLPRAA